MLHTAAAAVTGSKLWKRQTDRGENVFSWLNRDLEHRLLGVLILSLEAVLPFDYLTLIDGDARAKRP